MICINDVEIESLSRHIFRLLYRARFISDDICRTPVCQVEGHEWHKVEIEADHKHSEEAIEVEQD